MKNLIQSSMKHSSSTHELGHAFIRISLGCILLIFGYQKLTSGTQHLTQLGSAMSAFNITYAYLLWGYAAALTELCSGIAFILGFLTRLMCIPLAWLLIVAMSFHINKGDSFTIWGFACTLLCITIGFLIAGSGKYSLDYAITHKSHE